MKKVFKITCVLLLSLFLTSMIFNFQVLKTNNQAWSESQFFAIEDSLVDPDKSYDLVISDIISNNSDAENIDVLIRFDEILPGQAINGSQMSYFLTIYLEEEVVNGYWNPVAETSQQRYGDFINGPKEVEFIVQKQSFADQGQPFTTANGFKWFVNKAPSEKMRVRVAVFDFNPTSPASFQSLKITGAYRLY